MIDDVSKAWAAGFFEGEGSISIQISNRFHTVWVRIEVSQVDIEPLEWLNARWPGKIYYFDRGHNKSPVYVWRRATRKAVEFLRDIRPFLARRRVIERIDLALEFQAQKKHAGQGGHSVAYHAAQDVFWSKMRSLNVRGRKVGLNSPPRPTPIDQQLRLFNFDDGDLDVPGGTENGEG